MGIALLLSVLEAATASSSALPQGSKPCVVSLVFDEAGDLIAEPTITKSTGNIELDARCLSAARKAKHTPFASNGPTRNEVTGQVDVPLLETGETLPVVFLGGLTRGEIQHVITPAMPKIKYCYEKELNHDEALHGTLNLHWTITRDGDVVDVVIDNSFKGPSAEPLAACVQDILERLRFPKPKEGGRVFVTYPFVFSSSTPPSPPPASSTSAPTTASASPPHSDPVPVVAKPAAPPFGCSLFAR